MIVGVAKESYPGERRVALVPAVVPLLAKAGLEVAIESHAGEQAGYPDSLYAEKGAKILPDRAAVFSTADIIVQVLCYGSNDLYRQSRHSAAAPWPDSHWVSRPFGSKEVLRGDRSNWRDFVFGRTDAAHHARPEPWTRFPPWLRFAATKP